MQRYDNFNIKATKTEEGFILDKPIIARTGILKYLNADGSERYEYRPPEEAFDEDSLKSIRGKPITLGHVAMVSADNAGKIPIIGTAMSEGYRDGNAIRADITLYRLPSKSRELSCGYTLDLDETPGVTPDGEHYDAIQRNVRINHIALVPKGRAGIARLNMDGSQEPNEEVENMSKIRLDNGLEYEAAPEVGVFIDKMREDAAAKQKELDTLQAKYDSAISDLEKQKKELAEAEQKHKDNFDSAVKARVEMLESAKKFGIEKADSLTDKEIKIEIIRSVRKDMNLDGKSEDYINAAYDMALADKHSEGIKSQRQQVGKRNDSNDDGDKEMTASEALAKLRADEAALWTKEVK